LTSGISLYILIIILISVNSPAMSITQSGAIPALHNKPLNIPQHAVPSNELLGNQGALQIDHKGAIYTLRATSKGGLILTI
jgi:hemin uptake protein HemP